MEGPWGLSVSRSVVFGRRNSLRTKFNFAFIVSRIPLFVEYFGSSPSKIFSASRNNYFRPVIGDVKLAENKSTDYAPEIIVGGIFQRNAFENIIIVVVVLNRFWSMPSDAKTETHIG